MSLADFWRRLFGKNCRGSQSGHQRDLARPGMRCRLALQPLEDRRLLSLTLVGPEFRVNTVTAGSDITSSVAMNAGGDFVIAVHRPDGSDIGIFAQRFNPAGAPQGGEFRVNSFTTGIQRSPSVALDADGDFVIAWDSSGQDGSGYGVYAQRYNAAGAPQGGEFRVNTITFNSQSSPSVALDADGDAVITWSGRVPGGSGYGAFAQRYNAAGAPQGSEFRVSTNTTGRTIPSVALDADGDFVIAWHQYGADGSGYGIFAQRYSAAGVPQSGQFRVNTQTDNHQRDLSVAVDADGDFVIAWTSFGQDGSNTGVYLQRYNAAGVPQGGEFRVNTFTANAQRNPSLAMAAGGDFVVAWESRDQDGGDYGVYAQAYNAAGAPQGNELRVNTFTSSSQRYPSVAMDADGDAVVAWVSYIQDGGQFGVYAQRLTPTPSPNLAIIDDSDAAGFGVAGDWTAFSGFGVGRNDNVHTAFGESNLPADIASWTFNLSQGPGRYRVSATWFTNASFPYLFTDSARYEVSDATVGAVRGTTLINQKQYPNDFSDAGSLWEDLGTFDIFGSTLLVRLFSTADNQTQVVADAIRVERVAGLPPGPADGETQVNTFTTSHQAFSCVAVDSDGDTVIAWQSYTQDGSGNGVYVQRYNAAGVPQGGELRVNTFTLSNQQAPSVAMDGDGDFVVTWESWGQDGSGIGVYAQRFDGAGVPLGSEFRVNTFTTGNQLAPRVARDADGDFVITWKSFAQDGSGYGVYARRYNAAGVPQGSEFRVNTVTIDQQGDPSVAMDAAGDFVIAWHSYGNDGGGWGIYAQRYNAAGAPNGSEFRVNTSTAGNQLFPSVALDADGDFVITWQSGDGSLYGVFAQRYNAAGVPQGGETRVNTFTTAEQEASRVAMDSDGGFLVTWMGELRDGSLRGVYAQAYNAAGAPQGGELQVNLFITGNQVFPSVAVDADGDAVIAWHSYAQDGSGYGVYARRYTQPGEFRVNTFTANHQIHSSVASAAAGNTVVAWESFGQDGSGYGIYAQRYNAAGTAQGGEFRVNTFTLDQQGEARAAMDDDGDFVITWHSFGQDGSGWGIYGQRYNAAGAPQGSEFRVNTFTAGNQLYPSVAMDGAGDFVITWQSNGQDGSGYGVYAQRYSAAGVPQGGELRVNTFTAFSQRLPSVAMDASGEFLIAWESPQDFHGYGIYAQRYSAAGVPLGNEFRVNSFIIDFQVSASAAMEADGAFVIAWQSRGQDGSGYGIYAQRYNAVGVPQGSEIRVNTLTAGDQRAPSVALGADGAFAIAWQSIGQDGGEWGIYTQRYNALGVPQGSEFRANTTTAGNQVDPSTALEADGDLVIVWSSIQDGSGYGIYAQRFAVAATPAVPTPAGPEFRVNTFTSSGQARSSVAMDSDGDYVIAWQSDNQDGSQGSGIFAQRYNAAGVPQGSEFRVNTFITSNQELPSVAMDSDGDFVIAWQSWGDQDGSGFGIYAQRYNAAGARQGGEFQVNTYTNASQGYPSVAMDADGDFVIAWRSFFQDGVFWKVYAQRYNAAGVRQGGEFQVTGMSTSSDGSPSVAMDGDGDFVIAWYGSGAGGSGIFARRYHAAGTPLGSEFRVNTFTTGLQANPSIAMNAGGAFVIAWQNNRQDGNDDDVFAHAYNAAGVPQGGEFRVNAVTAGEQESPAVAVDGEGGFVITWHSSSHQDGSGYGVFAQRYDEAGVPQGNEFQANTFTTGNQVFPSVAMDADGEFVIAWHSYGQDGSAYGVYAQRYRYPQGSEFRVNTFTEGSQSIPSAAMAADGDFVIAWESRGQDAGSDGIYVQRYNAAGVPQGSEFRANTFTNNSQSEPSVAMDADGDFVITWHSEDQDGSGSGVYAQRYNAAGMPQGTEFRVNTVTAGNQGNPSVAIDFDGDFVIAWVSFGQDGSVGDVYAKRYNAAGAPQGGEFRVNSFTNNSQREPSVAMEADGDFVIVWDSNGQDGSNSGIYAQAYNVAGVPRGGEFRVNTFTNGEQRIPSVALDADGDFVIVWHSLYQDGSSAGVYAQRYNAARVPQGSEFRVNTFLTGGQAFPTVAMDTSGDFMIAWQSNGQDGSGYGVYAQAYNAAGVPQGGEFRVSTFIPGHQYRPSVALDADGDAVIAWSSASNQDGSSYGIFAQRLTRAGSPVANAVVGNSESTGGDSGSGFSNELPRLASLSEESTRGEASPNDAVDAALATSYWNEPEDAALPVGQASRLPEMATAYWKELDDVVAVLAEDAASGDWGGLDDEAAAAYEMTPPKVEALELALSDWW